MIKSDFSWLFEGITKDELDLDSLLAEISIAIVKERYSMKFSQKKFADFLGISQPMVSKLESLEYNPSIKTLFQICKKLNLNLNISVTKTESSVKDLISKFGSKKSEEANSHIENTSSTEELLAA